MEGEGGNEAHVNNDEDATSTSCITHHESARTTLFMAHDDALGYVPAALPAVASSCPPAKPAEACSSRPSPYTTYTGISLLKDRWCVSSEAPGATSDVDVSATTDVTSGM